jgi:hypothetical protein
LIKKYNDIIVKLLGTCKNTVRDTLMLEDYDEEGTIPIGAIKESFVTLDIELSEEVLDYLLFVVYQKSESSDKMKYQVILDLIEGKILQGGLSVGSET